MRSSYFVGLLAGAALLGAIVFGLLQGSQRPLKWRQLFATMTDRVSWRGFAWTLALPAWSILLYYGLVVHVRLVLGRWPRFGENLTDSALAAHFQAVMLAIQGIVVSLPVAAGILVVCLFISRWRHVALYLLSYGVGVAVAYGSLFLAPHSFLNWFLD